MLRAGSALGVCQDLGGRRFALTDAGAMLRGDVEGSLRGDVLFYSGMSRGGFTDIPEIVQTGRAGHSVTLGPEGFDLIGRHPERLDAMHRTMVGAGGGYGGLLAAVLQSYPPIATCSSTSSTTGTTSTPARSSPAAVTAWAMTA